MERSSMTMLETKVELAEAEERMSHSVLRIRAYSPFFGTLALFAERKITNDFPTAATNGRTIFFNPDFMATLSDRELDGVMLHEILHAALRHTHRVGKEDRRLWNIAADIVVNGLVAGEPWAALPEGAVRDESLEAFSVEEVCEILKQRGTVGEEELGVIGEDLVGGEGLCLDDKIDVAEHEAHWRSAWNRAATVERFRQHGKLPAELERVLDRINSPQLDWRTMLWRFLVRSPTDYSGFDRRQVYRGMYIEELAGENVSARIALDTSASIDEETLAQFISELREILRCYPHIKAEVYFADAKLYGPFDIEEVTIDAELIGGGGTSFVPFFDRVMAEIDNAETVCIYLTDGYGDFPNEKPDHPVLWVVTPGGVEDGQFPFGDVARLCADSKVR
jgi:predicted metal-dependent peptidase